MPKGRILALDLGERRIGLAVSDALGVTAQGLETMERTRSLRRDLDRLGEIARSREVSLALIGLPVQMSGEEGTQAARAREFGRKLHDRTGLAVEFWDERLTTREAGRILRAGGVSMGKRARAVDRLAAVIILESYLAWRARAS